MFILSPFESWILLIALGINLHYFVKYVIFNDTEQDEE